MQREDHYYPLKKIVDMLIFRTLEAQVKWEEWEQSSMGSGYICRVGEHSYAIEVHPQELGNRGYIFHFMTQPARELLASYGDEDTRGTVPLALLFQYAQMSVNNAAEHIAEAHNELIKASQDGQGRHGTVLKKL